MLKTRIKRRSAEGAQALMRLTGIAGSIVALNDEDLLDLADIFPAKAGTDLGAFAAAEVKKRNLTP